MFDWGQLGKEGWQKQIIDKLLESVNNETGGLAKKLLEEKKTLDELKEITCSGKCANKAILKPVKLSHPISRTYTVYWVQDDVETQLFDVDAKVTAKIESILVFHLMCCCDDPPGSMATLYKMEARKIKVKFEATFELKNFQDPLLAKEKQEFPPITAELAVPDTFIMYGKPVNICDKNCRRIH